MTDRFVPLKRMRLPYLLGFKPSPPFIMPALTSSSLYLPISANIFAIFSGSLKSVSASLFGVAFTKTMTFIGRTPLIGEGSDHSIHWVVEPASPGSTSSTFLLRNPQHAPVEMKRGPPIGSPFHFNWRARRDSNSRPPGS